MAYSIVFRFEIQVDDLADMDAVAQEAVNIRDHYFDPNADFSARVDVAEDLGNDTLGDVTTYQIDAEGVLKPY